MFKKILPKFEFLELIELLETEELKNMAKSHDYIFGEVIYLSTTDEMIVGEDIALSLVIEGGKATLTIFPLRN